MQPSEETNAYRSAVRRISLVGILGNLLLTAFKLVAGIVGHSAAMVSDAVHSASDIAGGLIVIAGVSMGEKQADPEHPYGHERLESIASLVLAVLLAGAGVSLGWSAISSLRTGAFRAAAGPGTIALIAALVSIAAKEAMYRYTMAGAKAADSTSLQAEAKHHRSDALSSVGALIGIVGARLGVPALDPIAGIVICLFILKTAIDVIRTALEQLIDHRCDEQTEREIRECVLTEPLVLGIDLMLTREFGRRIYVDLELSMDGTLTLEESHRAAERVHDALEERFPKIKHVMIHVNPAAANGVSSTSDSDVP